MGMKEAPSLAMAGKVLGGQTSKAKGGVNTGPNGKRPAIFCRGVTHTFTLRVRCKLGVQDSEWSWQ